MSKQIFEEICHAASDLSKGNKVKGWRPYKRRGQPLEAFFNKRLGWVVKKPVFIMDHRTPLCVRVPTIRLDNDWVAQPIVSKVDLKWAVETIRTTLSEFKGIHADLHVGNVGWHNNQAVMFDW